MKQTRNERHLERGEYLVRSSEFALRGQELPHAKLTDQDVIAIRSAVRQRDALRQHIRNNLSNEALARHFGVHERTIEKVVQRESWAHLL
jgi:hypothetical protein